MAKTFSDKQRRELLERIQRVVDVAVPGNTEDSTVAPTYSDEQFAEDVGRIERDLHKLTNTRRDPETEREQAKFLIHQGLAALPFNERAAVFDEVWAELWEAENA